MASVVVNALVRTTCDVMYTVHLSLIYKHSMTMSHVNLDTYIRKYRTLFVPRESQGGGQDEFIQVHVVLISVVLSTSCAFHDRPLRVSHVCALVPCTI